RIETLHPSETAVDDRRHTGDSDRGLGDIGREHHTLSLAGTRRAEHLGLLVERLISVQREDLDGVEFAQSRSCLSDLMSTRQKYKDIPTIGRGERRAEGAPALDFDRAVARPILKLSSDSIRATFAPQMRRRRRIV